MPLPEKSKTGGATKVKSSEVVAPPGAGGKPVETLPCPRCDSMNTKFCYYNNYSVTQPRHFCRQCQRYWTAGGTLRNVPVGGGSRKKNRATSSSYGARIEPYGLHGHRGNNNNHLIAGYPPPGSMLAGTMTFQQLPGFGPQQHLLTPDMAAFGSHPHPQLHHYVPGAYTTPSMMYPGPPALALQMGPSGAAGGQLTFELNLPGGENHNHNTPQAGSQLENATVTSQGLLENNTAASSLPQVAAQGSGGDVHDASSLNPGSLNPGGLNNIPGGQNLNPNLKTTASPPHGSSTIEEEGSTPTNGYSNNGYEEGDAVSSMWHEMHDMDNVLFQ